MTAAEVLPELLTRHVGVLEALGDALETVDLLCAVLAGESVLDRAALPAFREDVRKARAAQHADLSRFTRVVVESLTPPPSQMN